LCLEVPDQKKKEGTLGKLISAGRRRSINFKRGNREKVSKPEGKKKG